MPEGELGGEDIGGGGSSAPDGTARHRPLPCSADGRSSLAPAGRWRDAGSGKGRGWKLPPSLRIRVVAPGRSRTAGAGARRKMAYPGQPAPGGFYQGGVSGAGSRGGMWPAARGDRREPAEARSARPPAAAPAGRGRRRQLGAAPAGEGRERAHHPQLLPGAKVSAEGVIPRFSLKNQFYLRIFTLNAYSSIYIDALDICFAQLF